MDWALPKDEVLAVAEMVTLGERSVAASSAAGSAVEHGLASQVRKIAAHLKQGL